MYFDIHALQISFLAGRIFFKGLNYHGRNETVLVHDGYVTWRYWLRHVEASAGSQGLGRSAKPTDLPDNALNSKDSDEERKIGRNAGDRGLVKRYPCRVLAKCRGVEWFIYNRSPAYDTILETLKEAHPNCKPGNRTQGTQNEPVGKTHVNGKVVLESRKEDESHNGQSDEKADCKNSGGSGGHELSSMISESSFEAIDGATLPSLLNVLPLAIECNQGAIVLGNRNTRSIITARFSGASGIVDARPCHAPDLYKQVIEFEVDHPVIELKRNRDYAESQISEGAKIYSHVAPAAKRDSSETEYLETWKWLHKVRTVLQSSAPYLKSSVDFWTHSRSKSAEAKPVTDKAAGMCGQSRWLGLTRYLDEDDDFIEQERWKGIEYGAYPTLVDCPSMVISVHWDVPGLVPDAAEKPSRMLPALEQDINGAIPPDWGIDVKVCGGTINYGPWADRQRADVQAAFFPNVYSDASPAGDLSPGQARVSTQLKVFIEIEETTTVRIPTREDSKDWRWKGRAPSAAVASAKPKKAKFRHKSRDASGSTQSSEERPCGWVDVRIFANSTVSFTMDLFAKANGYKNTVDLEIKGLEMSSSVNQELLWRSKSQLISCDLSNPLGWNSLRQWQISVEDNDMDLFILRDHMFLLTDLINDWTSGPPGDFYTFVPFEYSIKLSFKSFSLYLNANDSNVVNSPSDLDENTFVVVRGHELDAELVIPSTSFRPSRSQVTFKANASDGGFKLLTPPHNTQHIFLNEPNVASLKVLKLEGSYNFHTTTSPNLTDTLIMDLTGISPSIHMFGNLIRCFMRIKENYFGDDIHFRTLEEYQDLVNRADSVKGQSTTQHSRLSNDLDVILRITAENSIAHLPAHLYSAEENIMLEVLSVVADLRVTNYYMDLAVSSSPISIYYATAAHPLKLASDQRSGVQAFVEGLEVFGHRLFGLPPTEPTYVCNWDFDIGSITGECSIDFVRCFAMSVDCFALSFDDAENAPPPLSSATLHDLTFLRAYVKQILVAVRIEEAAFLISTANISIDFDDRAGALFSEQLHLTVPGLILAAMDARKSASDRDCTADHANTHAFVELSLDLTNVQRKLEFDADRRLQQDHILHHDSRTERIPWLVATPSNASSEAPIPPMKPKPPAMPAPHMPVPLQDSDDFEDNGKSSKSSSKQSRSTPSRKSSFLGNGGSKNGKSRPRAKRKISNLRDDQDRTGTAATGSPGHKPIHAGYNEQASTGGRVSGVATSGFAFTSPYRKPYFPSLVYVPATSGAPALPQPLPFDKRVTDAQASGKAISVNADDDTKQSSFLVTFDQGVRAFCTPEALVLAAHLVAGFHMGDVVSLLDQLQLKITQDVQNKEDKRKIGRDILDAQIFVPWIGLNFSATNFGNDGSQDIYEFTIVNFAATAAVTEHLSPRTPSSTRRQISLHVLLDKAMCSACELIERSRNKKAVISLSLIDAVLWLWYGNGGVADLQLDGLEVSSGSSKVDDISALVRRTILISEDLVDRFVKIEKTKKTRLQLLLLLLAIEGKDFPDPSFMTRASYVLRSTSHQLRTSDSWKVISRLRYVYQCLPLHSQNTIGTQCDFQLASCPQDAGRQVTKYLEDWPTGDLDNVRSSILMRSVYDSASSSFKQEKKPSAPFKASISAQQVMGLVGKESSQSEFVVERVIVNVALAHNPSKESAASLTSESSDPIHVTVLTIQAHTAQIALRLHWALLDLVEGLVETVQAASKQSSSRPRPSAPHVLPPVKPCLHLIISSDLSILTLDTRNLRLTSLSQGLRTAVVSVNNEDYPSPRTLFNATIDADAASVEINSHVQKLTLYELRRLSLVLSRDGLTHTAAAVPWVIACTGNHVHFRTQVDPLELIEIFDNVLQNEVVHLQKSIQGMQNSSSVASPPNSMKEPDRFPRAHVALSLDSYALSFAVLPSLRYHVIGTGGCTSIASGLHDGNDMEVEFDLKAHNQVFETDASGELAKFTFPPINGHLRLDVSQEKQVISLNTVVEQVVLDASALHSLLTAFNRPEIVSYATNISEEFTVIQAHYENVFDMKASQEQLNKQKHLLYTTQIMLVGFTVQTSTSDSGPVGQGAELRFRLGQIQMRTTNKDDGNNEVLQYPELHVAMRSIRIDLLLLENTKLRPCGNLFVGAKIRSTSSMNDMGKLVRDHQCHSSDFQVNLFTETASVVVAILGHLQNTLENFDLTHEVKALRRLGYPRLKSNKIYSRADGRDEPRSDGETAALFSARYSLEVINVRVIWTFKQSIMVSPTREPENLVLSFSKIDLGTRRENAARLLLADFQLQMVPTSRPPTVRSLNSALLPEVVFNVAYLSTIDDRRLAFQAVGKSLDMRLTPYFILPANDIRRSIALAFHQVRAATARRDTSTAVANIDAPRGNLLGNKRLASLLVDADFAGAVVYIQGQSFGDPESAPLNVRRSGRMPQHGRYNQFTPNNATNSNATLRAPGIALKVEYRNVAAGEQSLNAEMKIDASSNTLFPTVVPLVMDISSNVKNIIGEPDVQKKEAGLSIPQPKFLADERLRGADPRTILGDCKLNLGLRICRQEFTLSCQPIAKVAATAHFEDIYMTVNTIQSQEYGRFYSMSAAFSGLQSTVQHSYSRESTGSFEVDSIVISLMNSKHISTANGISAILSISPMKAQINGKQSQDFFLFRDIWVPPEMRDSTTIPTPAPAPTSQAFIVQRYQKVAATGAFPWNATISLAELDVQVDLGQSLGKTAFVVSGFWVSSKKSSDWEQNLCLGFKQIAVTSVGRMSGFVELQDMKVRTSIKWPIIERAHNQTPLVQASLTFRHLRIKAAFDYQAFLVTDISRFQFLMYNVRYIQDVGQDRLFGILDGGDVQIFCTTASASQFVALHQAFQRLYEEKVAAYESSIKDLEQHLRRKSMVNPTAIRAATKKQGDTNRSDIISTLKLQTDVVVNLRAINLGFFPSTFFDNQVFKVEALDASARFAVVLDRERVHSTLSMTLGQLRVALSSVGRPSVPKTLAEVSVADVISAATGSRGGTILKVPKLLATMETWEMLDSNMIEYIFKSSFQGKVDVGWNYSRISYIRGMWNSHARALAQRLGKPLPQSAVQIMGGPQAGDDIDESMTSSGKQEKITAVVNVPQSKYQYTALQPAIIETPQLRDMGEATPPLEWIGLHRDRLPNLTHQIVIVPLLQVAKEVDEAYSSILGSA